MFMRRITFVNSKAFNGFPLVVLFFFVMCFSRSPKSSVVRSRHQVDQI